MANISSLIPPTGLVPDFATGARNLMSGLSSHISNTITRSSLFQKGSTVASNFFQRCAALNTNYNITGKAFSAANQAKNFLEKNETTITVGLIAFSAGLFIGALVLQQAILNDISKMKRPLNVDQKKKAPKAFTEAFINGKPVDLKNPRNLEMFNQIFRDFGKQFFAHRDPFVA